MALIPLWPNGRTMYTRQQQGRRQPVGTVCPQRSAFPSIDVNSRFVHALLIRVLRGIRGNLPDPSLSFIAFSPRLHVSRSFNGFSPQRASQPVDLMLFHAKKFTRKERKQSAPCSPEPKRNGSDRSFFQTRLLAICSRKFLQIPRSSTKFHPVFCKNARNFASLARFHPWNFPRKIFFSLHSALPFPCLQPVSTP
jgi:hypothetical protein